MKKRNMQYNFVKSVAYFENIVLEPASMCNEELGHIESINQRIQLNPPHTNLNPQNNVYHWFERRKIGNIVSQENDWNESCYTASNQLRTADIHYTSEQQSGYLLCHFQ